MVGTDIYLKFENEQHTGSFKIRGAMNKILSLSNAERKKGFVAASAGNHGRRSERPPGQRILTAHTRNPECQFGGIGQQVPPSPRACLFHVKHARFGTDKAFGNGFHVKRRRFRGNVRKGELSARPNNTGYGSTGQRRSAVH